MRYSSKNTSWTRHRGFGSISVGRINVLENLLFARRIVVGSKMVSLAREGTDMFLADARIHPDGEVIDASKWYKPDFEDFVDASANEVHNFEHSIC